MLRMPTVRPSLARMLFLPVAGALLMPAMLCADAVADQNFVTKVWPIIDKNCTSCHGAEKQKAKLRLDSKDAWLKGGEDGKIVVPGDPDHSDVVLAIKYQAKDEDQNMPPKKKTKLTPEQVDIIVQWIKGGMPWPDKK